MPKVLVPLGGWVTGLTPRLFGSGTPSSTPAHRSRVFRRAQDGLAGPVTRTGRTWDELRDARFVTRRTVCGVEDHRVAAPRRGDSASLSYVHLVAAVCLLPLRFRETLL